MRMQLKSFRVHLLIRNLNQSRRIIKSLNALTTMILALIIINQSRLSLTC
jgi:hypothetical protein